MATSQTVVDDGGTGTVSIPIDPYGKRVIVVDFVTVTYSPGAAAEVMTVSILNTSLAGMWKGAKYFDANTADTMHVDFPSGLPIWRTTSANINYGGAAIGGQVLVEVIDTGSTYVTVGFHYEHPAERSN